MGDGFAKKKDAKGPFGKGGPPFAGMGKKDGPGRGFGGAPWARSGDYGRGPGRTSDLDRRLERIIDDLEDLRRDLRRR